MIEQHKLHIFIGLFYDLIIITNNIIDQKLIILINDNSKNRKFWISLSWNFINFTKIS
jgi:hypothetical protein